VQQHGARRTERQRSAEQPGSHAAPRSMPLIFGRDVLAERAEPARFAPHLKRDLLPLENSAGHSDVTARDSIRESREAAVCSVSRRSAVLVVSSCAPPEWMESVWVPYAHSSRTFSLLKWL
jgi:hypothetical protein